MTTEPRWEVGDEPRFKVGDHVRYAWFTRGVRHWVRGTVLSTAGPLLFSVPGVDREEDYVLRQTDGPEYVQHVDAVTLLGELV